MYSFKKSIKGIVFNIQKYSIHDGPGIRTAVFLKGCPLKCEWCSNPESNQTDIEIMYNSEICTLCKKCISVCKINALTSGKESQFININRNKCDQCGECIKICPSGALTLVGRYMSVEEVLQEIEKDILFFRKSGGGITLSGGEPGNQPDFSEAILKSVYSMGIHTSIETSGYYSDEILIRLAKWTDLFLYDIKHVDDLKHIHGTGVSNKLIINNFKKLIENSASVIVRIPVIPGFNATEEDMRFIGQFLLEVNGFKEIHLLPYHRLGNSKVTSLGKAKKIKRKLLPEKELFDLKEVLTQFGFKVQIGG